MKIEPAGPPNQLNCYHWAFCKQCINKFMTTTHVLNLQKIEIIFDAGFEFNAKTCLGLMA